MSLAGPVRPDRASIDWSGIATITGVQARGAANVAGASPMLPPYAAAPAPQGLTINPIAALAGAAVGFMIARAAGWAPPLGAAGGAAIGGILL
jgi:hypothetical protein